MKAENVTGPVAGHAEGPVWWPGWGGLRWVDGYRGDLLTLRDDGIHRLTLNDPYAAFVRPRIAGGFIAAGEHTLYLADTADGEVREVARLLDDPAIRLNDGCCDPQGRLLAGSMAYDATPGAARLVRVDTDWSVTEVVASATVSNGIGFSPDGSYAYYADSPTRRVDVFDVVDRELTDRRPLVHIPESQGSPDGLTVAADGSVWVALWGGSGVQAYDPSGQLVARIDVPVTQTSACTFGGDDLGTLFVTTSAQGMGDDHGTEAGSVFAVRPGVTGLPVLPFAG
ncbi:MAG: SMP-30/gluconolactonase/LRE family protein [Actinomycetota bacterium]